MSSSSNGKPCRFASASVCSTPSDAYSRAGPALRFPSIISSISQYLALWRTGNPRDSPGRRGTRARGHAGRCARFLSHESPARPLSVSLDPRGAHWHAYRLVEHPFTTLTTNRHRYHYALNSALIRSSARLRISTRLSAPTFVPVHMSRALARCDARIHTSPFPSHAHASYSPHAHTTGQWLRTERCSLPQRILSLIAFS